MADFCKDCSIENFGEDIGDLAGLINLTEDQLLEEPDVNKWVVSVLCEGCGYIYVNNDGQRVVNEHDVDAVK